MAIIGQLLGPFVVPLLFVAGLSGLFGVWIVKHDAKVTAEFNQRIEACQLANDGLAKDRELLIAKNNDAVRRLADAGAKQRADSAARLAELDRVSKDTAAEIAQLKQRAAADVKQTDTEACHEAESLLDRIRAERLR